MEGLCWPYKEVRQVEYYQLVDKLQIAELSQDCSVVIGPRTSLLGEYAGFLRGKWRIDVREEDSVPAMSGHPSLWWIA